MSRGKTVGARAVKFFWTARTKLTFSRGRIWIHRVLRAETRIS